MARPAFGAQCDWGDFWKIRIQTNDTYKPVYWIVNDILRQIQVILFTSYKQRKGGKVEVQALFSMYAVSIHNSTIESWRS